MNLTDHTQVSPGPKFARPPVIETVLGIQFEPLREWRIVHYGCLWEFLRERFPRESFDEIEEKPSLEPQFERFGDKPISVPSFTWKILNRPDPVRAWFVGEKTDAGQRLLQVQPDRLLLNWRRKSSDSGSYPSYDKNKGEFLEKLNAFVEFANGRNLGEFRPTQCEVTYVNHIALGDRSFCEAVAAYFPSFTPRCSDSFLPTWPETGVFQLAYIIGQNQGRLHVEVRHARNKESGDGLIRLSLTARGTPESDTPAGAMAWLNIGHSWVVNGFRSLASAAARAEWGEQT